MVKNPAIADTFTTLSHLSIIHVSGSDAEDFLNGQFTINIKNLSENNYKFSAWCNPKGQVKTTFIIYRHSDKFNILLPTELATPFIKDLQIYILRSAVRISNNSTLLHQVGLYIQGEQTWLDSIISIPKQPGDLTIEDDNHCLCIAARRYIYITAIERQQQLWQTMNQHVRTVDNNVWQLLDIKAGYPWLTTQTTEKFLPQMLNLDVIGGLDRQKGCYPGQEIIARLYFLGQLKRRLYLASCSLDNRPKSGDQIKDSHDQRRVGIVIKAQKSADKFYLLGVIDDLAIADNRLQLENGLGLNIESLPYGTTTA